MDLMSAFPWFLFEGDDTGSNLESFRLAKTFRLFRLFRLLRVLRVLNLFHFVDIADIVTRYYQTLDSDRKIRSLIAVIFR